MFPEERPGPASTELAASVILPLLAPDRPLAEPGLCSVSSPEPWAVLGTGLAAAEPFLSLLCLLSNRCRDLGKNLGKTIPMKGGGAELQSSVALSPCHPVTPAFPSTYVPCASPDRGRPCLARVSLATGPRDAVQSICHQLSPLCSALCARSVVSRGR